MHALGAPLWEAGFSLRNQGDVDVQAHEREWKEGVEQGLKRLQARGDVPRHQEFWWLPTIDALYMKSLQPTDADPDSVAGRRRERIGRSFEIFPSVRADPFYEVEYAVPEAAGPSCFRALRAWMRQHHAEVTWPIEYRTLAADDIPISTAFERASVTLSVHQARGLPYEKLFADCEAILREHGGRPHWGNAHSLTATELAPLYPRWADFARVRRELDPQARFLSPYLRELLGA